MTLGEIRSQPHLLTAKTTCTQAIRVVSRDDNTITSTTSNVAERVVKAGIAVVAAGIRFASLESVAPEVFALGAPWSAVEPDSQPTRRPKRQI